MSTRLQTLPMPNPQSKDTLPLPWGKGEWTVVDHLNCLDAHSWFDDVFICSGYYAQQSESSGGLGYVGGDGQSVYTGNADMVEWDDKTYGTTGNNNSSGQGMQCCH
jgi:hypothetical protein